MAELLALEAAWEDVPQCPACRSEDEHHRAFTSLDDQGLSLTYLYCRRCGLVFQNPKLSDTSLEDFYRDYYHDQMMPKEEDVQRNIWVQHRRAEYMADLAAEMLPYPKLYLDVGASRGLKLAEFTSRFGVTGVGIEPGAELRRELLEKDMNVVPTLEDVPQELAGKIDLVTMSHVLEHLAHPSDFLMRLRDMWLSQDAKVLVEVPNLTWHKSLELAHLSAFHVGSLRRLFHNAGYRVVRLVRHGRPYSRRLPLFLLLVASPASIPEEPVYGSQPLWFLRLRRWYGTSYRLLYEQLALLRHGRRKLSPWRDISVE